MTANFVGAYYSAYNEEVLVWERDSSQEGHPRNLKRYEAPYYFYVKDETGEHTSLYREKVKRLDFGSKASFEEALSRYQTRKKFESDLNPRDKVLMKNYYNIDAPPLHYTLLDIEVEYDSNIGFSSPENPYAPINAITLFNQWNKEYITIAVPPKSWQGQDWDELLDKTLPSNVTLVRTEKELLLETLNAIEDSDVISGWNSDFFDMPYLVKRTEMVLGKEAAKRWCFRGTPAPRFEEVERFNEQRITVRLYGRSHIDFLQLFKKFAFGGRSSYALKSIADEELDIPKLEYNGTLENLYNTDFNLFCRYNIRDTEILDKLDAKFKYIDQANEMTHANTITLDGAMGSVRLIDTGIINYCHNVRNVVVPDHVPKNGPTIEGALVLSPKIGLHKWLGSVDINSLYPSTMRSLNISPEKIIGQFGPSNPMQWDGEPDWIGINAKDDNLHVLTFEDGTYIEATGAEWYEMLKVKKWAISGFGTVFDQGNGQGVIPGILTSWYAERKQLQKLKTEWGNKADEFKKGSIEYEHAKKMEEYYDKKQMVKKLLLNSLYGAVINNFDRFFDPRMGASTTATGRKITGHMISKISELLTGEYVDLRKDLKYEHSGGSGVKAGLLEWETGDEKFEKQVYDDYGQIQAIYTSDSKAIIYSDTDSIAEESIVEINGSKMQIRDAFCFLKGDIQVINGKEYKVLNDTKYFGKTYDPSLGQIVENPIEAIYRHKVSKARWRITLADGKQITVTNDHSIMVERNGKLIEIKASEINTETDVCICIG